MKGSNAEMKGQVIVVTGASKGIGAGIAKELANQGATVMLCSRNVEKLKALKSQIKEEGGKAHIFQLDVGSVTQIENVFKSIYNQFGRIDVLVNNAGLGNNHAALDVKEADWDEMMNINLKGLFFCKSLNL